MTDIDLKIVNELIELKLSALRNDIVNTLSIFKQDEKDELSVYISDTEELKNILNITTKDAK